MNIEDIQTVKLQDNGYLVNGNIFVPNAPGNKDYQAIQEWIALGNIPAPQYSEEEVLAKTKKELIDAIQTHLDSTAQQHGYDNIVSACSYAAIDNLFQAEGTAFIQWRSACWEAGFQILADVENSIRPIPSVSELIQEMPAFSPGA